MNNVFSVLQSWVQMLLQAVQGPITSHPAQCRSFLHWPSCPFLLSDVSLITSLNCKDSHVPLLSHQLKGKVQII